MLQTVDHFRKGQWRLGVVGLGYVGLPLLMAASEAGLPVTGFDIDGARVAELMAGRSHVEDVPDEDVQKALRAGVLFTSDEAALPACDAVVIAVPSPLGRNRQPDMSYIAAAADLMARTARPGQLLCLESTTYPGTTEEYLVPAVTQAGLVLDRDVSVCFSPERVDPGNPLQLRQITKVVGGVTAASGLVGAAAYGRFLDHVHLVSTARAAELTKLLENTYRAVNIALVNEMAEIAHAFDIDVWEVVDAAATKPFGFAPFYPGPGVGGHCIPLDPQFLAWSARGARVPTRFIDLAEQVNQGMPGYVVRRVADELNALKRPLSGTRVLGLGLSYKAGIGDPRESPAADVLRLLQGHGVAVGVLDRHVSPDEIRAQGFVPETDETAASGYDVALVLTDHDGVDYASVAHQVALVFDTRGTYRRRRLDRTNVVSL